MIEIQIQGRPWRAVIDTGFNGDLELPQPLRVLTNARFVGRLASLLAARQRIEEDVFLVDFLFDGQLLRLQATFVDGDEILIGTRMLKDHRLVIDFPAQTLTLSKT